VTLLTNFYAAMGNAPDTVGAMNAMAGALAEEGATVEQVAEALRECRKVEFPVRLPHIVNRLPGRGPKQQASEAMVAWDRVTSYVRKYVGNDCEGTFGPQFGSWPDNHPVLVPRDLDTLRRTGGWEVYKRMDSSDYPHQQKRFVECWLLWTPDKAGVPALPRPSAKQLPPPEHEFTVEERRNNLECFRDALKGFAGKFEMEAKQRREQDWSERQKERETMRQRKQSMRAQVEELASKYSERKGGSDE
jgi:hypothetical protein